ncbi:hypothetical protein HDU82_007160 [Entophlyctis luteolus]|nr:hypothetical protein HDU82_007160 [Entophlyctis luteolus]
MPTNAPLTRVNTFLKLLALFSPTAFVPDPSLEARIRAMRVMELGLEACGDSLLDHEEFLQPYFLLLNKMERLQSIKSTWDRLVVRAMENGNKAPQLSLTTYNIILRIFGKHGFRAHADEAFEMLSLASYSTDSMESKCHPPDEHSYYYLVSAHANATPPALSSALKILADMTINGSSTPTPAIFTPLIRAAGKSRDLKTMKVLFEMMEEAGMELTSFNFNAAIDAYVKAGDIENALRLLEDWKQRLAKHPNNSPNLTAPATVTYNTLLSACAKEGQMNRGQEILETMAAAGLEITHQTVTSYMDLFKRKAMYNECREAFDMFEKQFGIRKFTEGYNVLLACAGYHGRDVVQLKETYNEMLGRFCKPSLVTFRILVSAYAYVLDFAGIDFVVQEMARFGFTEMDSRIAEKIAVAVVRKAKLGTDDSCRPVVPILIKYLGSSAYRSTKVSNCFLDAHILDFSHESDTSPFDFLAFLSSIGFEDLFADDVSPDSVTLLLLLRFVERNMSRAINRPLETKSELERIRLLCGKAQLDDAVESIYSSVLQTLSEPKK